MNKIYQQILLEMNNSFWLEVQNNMWGITTFDILDVRLKIPQNMVFGRHLKQRQ